MGRHVQIFAGPLKTGLNLPIMAHRYEKLCLSLIHAIETFSLCLSLPALEKGWPCGRDACSLREALFEQQCPRAVYAALVRQPSAGYPLVG